MKRGSRLILPLACAMLLSACARTTGIEARPATVNPSTAIALSVLAEAVYLVDPVTGDRTVAADDLTDFQSGYAVWSPDHQRLAYSDGAIVVLDVASGKRTLLANGTSLSAPAWSRDGRHLAYGNGTTLWLTPSSSFQPLRLILPKTLAPLAMAWGPDARIAFDGLQLTCDRLGSCLSTDHSEIWTIDADGSRLKRITRVGHAEKPKWSPDGSRILFVVRPAAANQASLWVVDANGANAREIPGTSGAIAADWSPDGQRVAFVRAGEAPGTLQLFIIGVDGSAARSVGAPIPGLEATVSW